MRLKSVACRRQPLAELVVQRLGERMLAVPLLRHLLSKLFVEQAA